MVETNRPSGETEMAKKFEPVEKAPRAMGAAREESEADQQKITVKALRHFHKEGDMRGEMVKPGDSFETTHRRAVELRANGLIEYGNEGDEKTLHGEEGAKVVSERVKRMNEAATLKDEHKATPLRNPKLEMAEVSDTETDEAKAARTKKSGK